MPPSPQAQLLLGIVIEHYGHVGVEAVFKHI